MREIITAVQRLVPRKSRHRLLSSPLLQVAVDELHLVCCCRVTVHVSELQRRGHGLQTHAKGSDQRGASAALCFHRNEGIIVRLAQHQHRITTQLHRYRSSFVSVLFCCSWKNRLQFGWSYEATKNQHCCVKREDAIA